MNSILFVDDDTNLLDGYRRNLRASYAIETASSAAEGLRVFNDKGPFSVVVSDFKMPQMNGVEFLTKIREISPDSVRIMLTGFADAEVAIRAVNNSNIFRLLTKPAPREEILKTLNDAMEFYRLKKAERDLLSKTLSGSIKVMTDLLALVRPRAMSKSLRVRRMVRDVARIVDPDNMWQVEIAATLSQIGCITMPDDVLEKIYLNESLQADEKLMFQNHPKVGSSMISSIPRLEKVAEIILYQEKLFNGKGFPFDKISGKDIPAGSRILKIVLDFDALMSSGISAIEAVEKMRRKTGAYDEEILDIFFSIISEKKQYVIKKVSVSELAEDMVLAEDIRTASGILVGGKGQEVTPSLVVSLTNYLKNRELKEPIRVVQTVN